LMRGVIRTSSIHSCNRQICRQAGYGFLRIPHALQSESTLLRTSSDRHAFLVPRPQILSQNPPELRCSNAAQQYHHIRSCAQHDIHQTNILIPG